MLPSHVGANFTVVVRWFSPVALVITTPRPPGAHHDGRLTWVRRSSGEPADAFRACRRSELDDRPGMPGPLGGEHHAVARQAGVDPGDDQFGPAVLQGVEGGVHDGGALGEEVVDLDAAAVSGELPEGAEDLRVPVLQRGERGQDE